MHDGELPRFSADFRALTLSTHTGLGQGVGKRGKQPCDTSGLAIARTCILPSAS